MPLWNKYDSSIDCSIMTRDHASNCCSCLFAIKLSCVNLIGMRLSHCRNYYLLRITTITNRTVEDPTLEGRYEKMLASIKYFLQELVVDAFSCVYHYNNLDISNLLRL